MNVDPPLVAQPEELEENHGVKRQIFATIAVSFACLNAGLTIGWAQTDKIVLSPGSNSTQNSFMQEERVNHVLKQSFYSSMMAAVLLAVLARFFGRYMALLVASLFSIIMGVSLVLNSNEGLWLTGSVIVSGITLGPMLLSEAVHKNIRGALMSACFFQLNFGVLLALTIGSYFNPVVVKWCLTVLYVIQFLLIFQIAESPMFLAWMSNKLRAEGSLFWYSGGNRSIAQGQLSVLAEYYANNNKFLVATLKGSEIREALSLVVIKVALMAVGYWILIEFRIKMYFSANGHMSKNSVDVLVASVQTVASLAMIFLMDSLGRKKLMYISHYVNPCAMFISWIYYSFIWSAKEKDFCWFPVLCSIVYTASFTVSMVTYLSILINEIFPLPIKDLVSTFAGFLVAVAALMPIWFRNYLDDYIAFGFDNLKYFTATEMTGSLWVWLYAHETNGKSLMTLRTW